MIKLFQVVNDRWGIPSPSPFCMKVETYLRMVGIPFISIPSVDLADAPKRKLPYIEDEGNRLGDSQLIIQYLKSRYGDPLDDGLTHEEWAIAHMIRRTLEEGLYFCLVFARWQDEAPWRYTNELYFRDAPAVAATYRAYMLDQLQKQGTGRHSSDEVANMAALDIDAVAEILGSRPFLLGLRPRSVDATVYAFLSNIIDVPVDTSLARSVRRHRNLVEYSERMRSRYFVPA